MNNSKWGSIEIRGWEIKRVSSAGDYKLTDPRGVEYFSTFIRNTERILIQKKGTTRFVRFPKYILDPLLSEIQKATKKTDLEIVNKPK